MQVYVNINVQLCDSRNHGIFRWFAKYFNESLDNHLPRRFLQSFPVSLGIQTTVSIEIADRVGHAPIISIAHRVWKVPTWRYLWVKRGIGWVCRPLRRFTGWTCCSPIYNVSNIFLHFSLYKKHTIILPRNKKEIKGVLGCLPNSALVNVTARRKLTFRPHSLG